MRPIVKVGVVFMFYIGAFSIGRLSSHISAQGGRSVIEHDQQVGSNEGGPYGGTGTTTGYAFFARVRDSTVGFRKRVLYRGSSIGYHLHDGSEPGLGDEVYYVVAGRGELTLDSVRSEVRPGPAILTRTGSSHGLRQLGETDLVIIVTCPESANLESEKANDHRESITSIIALEPLAAGDVVAYRCAGAAIRRCLRWALRSRRAFGRH